MCIRISFTPTTEQIAAAQWALVDTLERAVGDGWRYADAPHTLRDLLQQNRARSPTPTDWARALVEALVERLASLQAAVDAAQAQLADQRSQRERLEQALAAREAHPAREQIRQLQEQLTQLTSDRDRWLNRAVQAERRPEGLERALAAEQQAHQDDVAALQQRIADLNRIVAQQQETLNARA